MSNTIKTLTKQINNERVNKSITRSSPGIGLNNSADESNNSAKEKLTIQFPPINQKLNDEFSLTNKRNSIPLDRPSIMFTRVDAEQNKKRLKGAINKGYLTDDSFEVKIIFFF